jgi:hypothetical protein
VNRFVLVNSFLIISIVIRHLDYKSIMAESAFVGTQTNVVAELPPEAQRRRSSAISGRRASVVRALNVLHGGTVKNPNMKNDVSEVESNTDLSDAVFDLKQAHGETHAEGGDTRWYKPIETYEGRHRWDPTADWTEKEEKQVVRKVTAWFITIEQS